jgi:hypothetical protein
MNRVKLPFQMCLFYAISTAKGISIYEAQQGKKIRAHADRRFDIDSRAGTFVTIGR